MTKIISVRLDNDLIQKLKERAKAEDRSLSNLISKLLKEGMQDKNCEKKGGKKNE